MREESEGAGEEEGEGENGDVWIPGIVIDCLI